MLILSKHLPTTPPPSPPPSQAETQDSPLFVSSLPLLLLSFSWNILYSQSYILRTGLVDSPSTTMHILLSTLPHDNSPKTVVVAVPDGVAARIRKPKCEKAQEFRGAWSRRLQNDRTNLGTLIKSTFSLQCHTIGEGTPEWRPKEPPLQVCHSRHQSLIS